MKLSRTITFALVAALSAGAWTALTASDVDAQTAPAQTTLAAKSLGIAKLPGAVIAQFKSDPQSLLTTYASAGLPLSTQVRGLVLTDPSLVATLIDLAAKANDSQKGAIGAGLAEAARILAAANPALAAQIRQAVAQSGLEPLVTAFMALANGATFADTGGGGAAGSGGPIGGIGIFTGSNTGSSTGAYSFGQANGASPFGAISGMGGGGSTAATSQSTSPSKSAI